MYFLALSQAPPELDAEMARTPPATSEGEGDALGESPAIPVLPKESGEIRLAEHTGSTLAKEAEDLVLGSIEGWSHHDRHQGIYTLVATLAQRVKSVGVTVCRSEAYGAPGLGRIKLSSKVYIPWTTGRLRRSTLDERVGAGIDDQNEASVGGAKG